MTNEQLNTNLYFKMSSEFSKYEAELLDLPSKEILEHAYAYTVKQDILLAMEEYNLPDKACKALLAEKNSLETVFSRWENHEGHYMDEIRDVIECAANERMRDDFLKARKDAR